MQDLGWSVGAVWRRWDPHLHAPGTLLNDQFNGDWDAYLQRIETSAPTIEVLGVTDYMCIRTYKAVRQRKQSGRLAAVRMLFPNVELRLDIKTEKAKPINLHLLFSPEDAEHEAHIERVLGLLTCEFNGQTWRCAETDFVHIGKLLERNLTDEKALQLGASQFKVTLRGLREVWRSDVWFRRNCIPAVAGSNSDGTAGLQADDSYKLMRAEIESFADAIFAATPKQRTYWLGKGVDSRDVLETKYRGLKPCIHGSDAHSPNDVGAPDLDRYCWIKGDPTFDALRQAVIEPEERAWIGAVPPESSRTAPKVVSLSVTDAPWLARSTMALNSGLVAVVGARGSGKTALVDLLGRGASAPDVGAAEASFLRRARDLLGESRVALTWSDGGTTSQQLKPDPFEIDDETPHVRYLSQQFVDRLCSATGLATQLREEIERVVFDETDDSQRLGTASFGELGEIWLEPLRRRRDELRSLIEAAGASIEEEEELRSQLALLKKEREIQAQKLVAAREELKKLIPKGKDERAKLLMLLEQDYTQVEGIVEDLRRRKKRLEDVEHEVQHIRTTVEPARLARMQSTFAGANLGSEDWKSFAMTFSGDVDAIVKRHHAELNAGLTRVVEGETGAPPPQIPVPSTYGQAPGYLASTCLNTIRAQRDALRKEVGIDAVQQRKYEAQQATIQQMEATLRRTDSRIAHTSGADDRRKLHVESRQQSYFDVFGTFAEEEAALVRLYKPLETRLADATGAAAKLRFIVQRRVALEEWVEKGERLLDLRANSSFRGRGALLAIATKELLPAWKKGGAAEVRDALEAFRVAYGEEFSKARPSSASDAERRQWARDVATWVFSTEHVSIEYAITYDGVAIEQLSPGTRGIVLLILFLVIDRSDRRPLIVDQPEENLDPKSVFDELVPHFREARRHRQVIIVTHNANLVVNTDADQVIVASAVPSASGALPTITYGAGPLEDPAIRAAVCSILEGGERAFVERERRYRIRRPDVVSSRDDLRE